MSGVEASTGGEAPGRPEAGPGLVIGLLGPTAVGKTAVAVALARALGTRVISCDSMQVYRGFAVLTDQPQSPQPGGVQHALVGFADPAEALSAVQYAAMARPLLAADVAAGAAVIAGGTGLYLRAALAPLSTAPADPELRTALEARAAAEGAGALHAELSRLDPQAAAEVDPKNPRRVVRALEAVLAGGGTRWSGREDLWDPVYDHPTLVVGLVRARDILAARIAARSARMLEDGAVEEVDRYRREHGWEATEPGGRGHPERDRLSGDLRVSGGRFDARPRRPSG